MVGSRPDSMRSAPAGCGPAAPCWGDSCLASSASRRKFFFQAEDGIRDRNVTGVQTCALPILLLATVLVAPHLTVYDLVILAPAFLLLGDWSLQTPPHPLAQSVQALLYISYPLFLDRKSVV